MPSEVVLPLAPPGTLLRVSMLSGASLAAFPGTKSYIAEGWAAGGGGGGVSAAGALTGCVGGGGASGGRFWHRGTDIPPSYTFSIGTGGPGGTNTGGDGQAGGDLTFSAATAVLTAKGGPGGKGATLATSLASRIAGGFPPAIGTGAILNGSGYQGFAGTILAIALGQMMSGAGAGSDWGGGGAARTTAGAGNAAIAMGAGGGGALGLLGSAGAVGGAGFDGGIRLWEYA